MTPQAASALQKGIASISPAANPGTPKVREDHNTSMLLDVQRIRISLERAMENEEDGAMTTAYKAMHGAIMQRLLGMDGTSVLTYLQQAASSTGGAGMMGGAPAPSPTPAPAAAMQGPMPPQGGGPGMSPSLPQMGGIV